MQAVARAFDAADNQGQSSAVTVNVENASPGDEDTKPPTVTITSPASGSTVSGAVTLTAYATDEGQVSEVRIYVDGALKCAGDTSVSCRWNSRKVDPGGHTIMATAKDQAGNAGENVVSVAVVSNGGKGGGRGKPKK